MSKARSEIVGMFEMKIEAQAYAHDEDTEGGETWYSITSRETGEVIMALFTDPGSGDEGLERLCYKVDEEYTDLDSHNYDWIGYLIMSVVVSSYIRHDGNLYEDMVKGLFKAIGELSLRNEYYTVDTLPGWFSTYELAVAARDSQSHRAILKVRQGGKVVYDSSAVLDTDLPL